MSKPPKINKNGSDKKQEFRKKLLETLKEILEVVEIKNNYFLDWKPFYKLRSLEIELKDSIKGNKNSWANILWAKYESSISDEPLTDYFFEEIDKKIKSILKYDSEKPNFPLVSLDEFKDVSVISENLVSAFDSLPNEYKIFIELPSLMFEPIESILEGKNFKISEKLSLITIDENQKTIFPETTIENPRRTFSLFSSSPKEISLYWKDYIPYLEISTSGYVGIWADTAPIRNAQILIRSFFGIGYALGLFEKGYSSRHNDSFITIYQKVDSEWYPQKSRKFPSDISRGMDSFHLSQNTTTEKGAKFFRLKDSRIRQLEIIRKVFQNEYENEKLLLASQWLFDSFCGDDELLSFVKATICLEILLGDKAESDTIGIGVLLANRCAYLISSNKNEREQIIKEFKEIYTTRSNIVHNGKNTLSSKERSDLNKLRSLCRRVIFKELQSF